MHSTDAVYLGSKIVHTIDDVSVFMSPVSPVFHTAVTVSIGLN